jgi:inosine-uridine nucleoside N-ribohydrolase
MIYVMGGALNVPGNLRAGIKTDNTTAEWNIFVDPTAAEEVVRSGIPITLVGLDATQHAPLTMAFYQKLAADETTVEAKFVHKQFDKQIALIRSGSWFFWDQLTAVVATDESVVTMEPHNIRIITEAGPELGRVVEDSAGAPARVAVGVDASRFEQIFLNVLNGRQP